MFVHKRVVQRAQHVAQLEAMQHLEQSAKEAQDCDESAQIVALRELLQRRPEWWAPRAQPLRPPQHTLVLARAAALPAAANLPPPLLLPLPLLLPRLSLLPPLSSVLVQRALSKC